MQRFHFNCRTHKPGELVATYVAELRILAEYCNFGDTPLVKMLRDRLAAGINDDGIQKKLLTEPTLTFKCMLDITQSCEEAEKYLREMRGS